MSRALLKIDRFIDTLIIQREMSTSRILYDTKTTFPVGGMLTHLLYLLPCDKHEHQMIRSDGITVYFYIDSGPI